MRVEGASGSIRAKPKSTTFKVASSSSLVNKRFCVCVCMGCVCVGVCGVWGVCVCVCVGCVGCVCGVCVCGRVTHSLYKPPAVTAYLWLKVSVDDSLLVHEGDSREKLPEEGACLRLCEAVVSSQAVQ